MEELEEFYALIKEGGVDQVTLEIVMGAESEGQGIFYRLISMDGSILKALNMEAYDVVGVSVKALEAIGNNEPYFFETVSVPGNDYNVRIIYGAISQSMIFNMGIFLEDNYEFFGIFRNLILLLMIPLFFYHRFYWLVFSPPCAERGGGSDTDSN